MLYILRSNPLNTVTTHLQYDKEHLQQGIFWNSTNKE